MTDLLTEAEGVKKSVDLLRTIIASGGGSEMGKNSVALCLLYIDALTTQRDEAGEAHLESIRDADELLATVRKELDDMAESYATANDAYAKQGWISIPLERNWQRKMWPFAQR